MTRFELGRTTATPGALAALARAGLDPAGLFLRHSLNDWGDLCEPDRQADERALADGGRLLSEYALPGGGSGPRNSGRGREREHEQHQSGLDGKVSLLVLRRRTAPRGLTATENLHATKRRGCRP